MSQPLAATLETLRTLPDVVESWFRAIPPAHLDVRRRPDAWTLREHLYHVAGVQHMLMGRMLLLHDSPNPEIVPYFPQNEPALAERFPSVDAAFAEYRTRRAEQLALLHTMDDVVWNKSALHAEYERYDLGILVHHMVFHEYWHFYRMEELWLTRDKYLK
jgi:uncharacterized damage-inducible protein DinB